MRQTGIQPRHPAILSDKCFACHGFDSKHARAGLRLDTTEGAIAAGESGACVAIKARRCERSEVWRWITSDVASEKMPPKNRRSI
ncbi:MAG: c-type cytochrome domain-containing protein [Pirellulales bacterium]